MKRLTILSLLSLMIISAWGQSSVQRDKVILEVVTGTWCVFCPGWALAADDFHKNGDEVAVIEYHGGDAFQTTSSLARINYYNATGYPTAVFDGTDLSDGGDPTNSVYNQNYYRYTNAYGVASPVELAISWTYDSTTQVYSAAVITNQVNTFPMNASPVLHVAITESHIPANWFGLSEINFVEKAMLPSASGTPLTLQIGVPDTSFYSFSLDPGSLNENSEMVVFVQDPNSKVIFNGTTKSLERPTSVYDAAVVDFATTIGASLCRDDVLAPEVRFVNNGGAVLTSLDLIYSVNNEPAQTYTWNGSLQFGEEAVVTIPALNFTQVNENNELKVFLGNPNGNVDQDASNDLLATTWDYPTYNAGTYQLIITPDVKASEITWEVINEKDGTIAASGGPYFDGSTSLIVKQFPLGTNTGCYTFRMMDAGGNGMLDFSAGNYQLRDNQGNIVAMSADGNFGALDQSQFSVAFATAVEPLASDLVKVFPNPTSSLFMVEMPELSGQDVSLDLYQINGALVSTGKSKTGQYQFDLSDQAVGVYMLKIQTTEGVFVQKIVKQ